MQVREEVAFAHSFGQSPPFPSLSYLPPSDAGDRVPSALPPISAFVPTSSTCPLPVSCPAPLAQPYDASCFPPAFLDQMPRLPCKYFSCLVLGPFCRVRPFWRLQGHVCQRVSI